MTSTASARSSPMPPRPLIPDHSDIAAWMSLLDEFGEHTVTFCCVCSRSTCSKGSANACRQQLYCACPARESVVRSTYPACGQVNCARCKKPPAVARKARRRKSHPDRHHHHRHRPQHDFSEFLLREDALYTFTSPSALLALEIKPGIGAEELQRSADALLTHINRLFEDADTGRAKDAPEDPAERRQLSFYATLAILQASTPLGEKLRLLPTSPDASTGGKNRRKKQRRKDEQQQQHAGTPPVSPRTLPVCDELGELPKLPVEDMCVLHYDDEVTNASILVDLDGLLEERHRRLSRGGGASKQQPPPIEGERVFTDVLQELIKTRTFICMRDRLVDQKLRAGEPHAFTDSLWHECWDWVGAAAFFRNGVYRSKVSASESLEAERRRQQQQEEDEESSSLSDRDSEEPDEIASSISSSGDETVTSFEDGDDESASALPVDLARMELVWDAMPLMVRHALFNRCFTLVLRGTNSPRLAYLLDPLLRHPLHRIEPERDCPIWQFRRVRLSTAGCVSKLLSSDGLQFLENYALLQLSGSRLLEFMNHQDFSIDGTFLARTLLGWIFLRKIYCDLIGTALARFCRFVLFERPVRKQTSARRDSAPSQPVSQKKKPPQPKEVSAQIRTSAEKLRSQGLESLLSMFDQQSHCLCCEQRDCAAVLSPCRHVYACLDCARRETVCRICKQPVDAVDAIRLWYSTNTCNKE